MYEMLAGYNPYKLMCMRGPNDRQKMMLEAIVNPDVELDFPKWVTKTAKDLVLRLTKKNPKRRIGAKDGIKEIKAHPFFKDVDWDQVSKKKMVPIYKPSVSGPLDTKYVD
jgi:serine/threonine protein kinase